MTDVRAAFDEYDADANGKIDLIEFRAIVAKLGLLLDPAEAEGLFDIIDDDETGFIEYREFEAWYADHLAKG